VDKAHDLRNVSVEGCILRLVIDGTTHQFDLTKQSHRLAAATQEQRARVEVSPSGYGLHWPDIDEDLSIDGLLGIKHAPPLMTAEP
jgi:hypothetical protein